MYTEWKLAIQQPAEKQLLHTVSFQIGKYATQNASLRLSEGGSKEVIHLLISHESLAS